MDTQSSATLGDSSEDTTATRGVTSEKQHAESLETIDVTVKAYSWPADARGLLHSKSPVASYKEFRVRATKESYVVSQDGLIVEMQVQSSFTSSTLATLDCQDLVVIKPDRHGNMVLTRTRTNYNSDPDMWLNIVKGNTPLSIGSVVRFGSVKVKVIDIVSTSDDMKTRDKIIARLSHPHADLGLPHPTRAKESIPNPTCRICLDGFEEGNPLIEPCQCRGSVQYIHVDCLVHWINGQLKIRQLPGGGGSYLVRSINCELCKFPYSPEVYSHCLIERPLGPHIVLLEQDNKIHVIALNVHATTCINVGRSKESDLWLTDISVSRKHALIKVGANGEVTLEDSRSKFGTLLEIPKSIPLHIGASPLSVQIGNVMLSIQLSHPRRIFEYLFVPKRFQAQIGQVRLVETIDPDVLVIDMDREGRRMFPRTANPLLHA